MANVFGANVLGNTVAVQVEFVLPPLEIDPTYTLFVNRCQMDSCGDKLLGNPKLNGAVVVGGAMCPISVVVKDGFFGKRYVAEVLGQTFKLSKVPRDTRDWYLPEKSGCAASLLLILLAGAAVGDFLILLPLLVGL
jgi:hypothetical protein